MRRMTTIRFEGELGQEFGSVHNFSIATPRQAIFAISSQVYGFKRYIKDKNYHFSVIEDGEARPMTHKELDGDIDSDVELTLIPMLEGSGRAFSVIAGIALIAGAIFFAPAVIPAATAGGAATGGLGATAFTIFGASVSYGSIALFGGALLLGGIGQLLAPTPDLDARDNQPASERQNYFGSPANLATEGLPIYVPYGDVYGGSLVAHSGLNSYDIVVGYEPFESGVIFNGYGYGFRRGNTISGTPTSSGGGGSGGGSAVADIASGGARDSNTGRTGGIRAEPDATSNDGLGDIGRHGVVNGADANDFGFGADGRGGTQSRGGGFGADANDGFGQSSSSGFGADANDFGGGVDGGGGGSGGK